MKICVSLLVAFLRLHYEEEWVILNLRNKCFDFKWCWWFPRNLNNNNIQISTTLHVYMLGNMILWIEIIFALIDKLLTRWCICPCTYIVQYLLVGLSYFLALLDRCVLHIPPSHLRDNPAIILLVLRREIFFFFSPTYTAYIFIVTLMS